MCMRKPILSRCFWCSLMLLHSCVLSPMYTSEDFSAHPKQMHSYQHTSTLTRKQREARQIHDLRPMQILRPQPPAYASASVSRMQRVMCRCGRGFGLPYHVRAGHSRPKLRMSRLPLFTPVLSRVVPVNEMVTFSLSRSRVLSLHTPTCTH
jgi:hypothetical protein